MAKEARGESGGVSCMQFSGHMVLDSSMVEHTAVNRGVVGSSPTRGAYKIWLHGQAVKTSPFHGGIRGSIPLGTTKH